MTPLKGGRGQKRRKKGLQPIGCVYLTPLTESRPTAVGCGRCDRTRVARGIRSAHTHTHTHTRDETQVARGIRSATHSQKLGFVFRVSDFGFRV